MSKAPTLIIAEKPSLGRAIAKALGGQVEKPFTFNGESFIVVSAAGHLIELLEPAGHDSKWAEWEAETLPIIPEKLMYRPRDDRAHETLLGMKQIVEEHNITQCVSAGDAAREGSHIVSLIWGRFLGKDMKDCRRAWFMSLTDEALQEAFSNLKPAEFDAGLQAAGEARSRADYVLGMSASRAAGLAVPAKGGLSIGRVQTPTLKFIVDADRKRSAHKSASFYTVKGAALDGSVEWRKAIDSDENKLESQAQADAVVAASEGKGSLVKLEERNTSHKAPMLFDLTELQRAASTAFGFSASRTLEIAQSLYETHKALSYPRTEFRFLPSDMQGKFGSWVRNNLPKGIDGSDVNPAVVCDDKKVGDHYAIIPTGKAPSSMTGDEKKIFNLVVERSIAATLPVHEVARQVYWINSEDNIFRGARALTVSAGWAAVTNDTFSDELISGVKAGDSTPVTSLFAAKGETKPPARMSESKLLKAMSTAGKDIDENELVAVMKDIAGIGTPATRASIIEGLISRGYVKRQGKSALEATPKGHAIVTLLESNEETKLLVSAELTAQWELDLKRLDEVRTFAQAKADMDAFDNKIDTFTTAQMPQLLSLSKNEFYRVMEEAASEHACPSEGCNGFIIVTDKFAKCSTNVDKDNKGCGSFLYNGGKKPSKKMIESWLADVASGKTNKPKAEKKIVEGVECPRCSSPVKEIVKDGETIGLGCTKYDPNNKAKTCGYTAWGALDTSIAAIRAYESLGKCNACSKGHMEKKTTQAGKVMYACSRGKACSKGSPIWATDFDGNEKPLADLKAELSERKKTKKESAKARKFAKEGLSQLDDGGLDF